MTARAFVIGDPIAHSRSPLIHRHWLRRYGLAGSYDPVHVRPDALPGFVAEIRGGAFIGGNVTIPHKEAIARLVDDLDPAARAIGAVNTVWTDRGRLIGGNTDALGFLANLDAARPGWDEDVGRAVILGAGGAARAVLHGLVARRIGDICIANRTPARAEALCADMATDGLHCSAIAMDDLPDALAGTGLVVNATSRGMTGHDGLDLDLDALPDAAIVNDLVYVPFATDLLTAARARGLVAVDGLGMLLHQAVPGFERWFGVRPEVTDALRSDILRDLGEAR